MQASAIFVPRPLSLADIPLPAGTTPPVDETDDLREELEAQSKGPDRWVELGLHTTH